MTPLETLERFFSQHRAIELELEACEKRAGEPALLAERLRSLSPLLLEHLELKDAFYERLCQLCSTRGDAHALSIATIFESNMKIQSSAMRRFCHAVKGELTPLLVQSFKTMATVIRNRISSEERAVFPLYAQVSG